MVLGKTCKRCDNMEIEKGLNSMVKRSVSIGLVAMLLCLALTGVANATPNPVTDAQVGTTLWIAQGHIELGWTAYLEGFYSLDTYGYTQVYSSQAPKPNMIYVKAQNWDGNTLVSYGVGDRRKDELLDGMFVWIQQFEPAGQEHIAWTAVSPRVTGYHYARWDAVVDACATAVELPPMGRGVGPAATLAIPVDVDHDPWVAATRQEVSRLGRMAGDVTPVTLLEAISALPELLGKNKGLALAHLFSTTLTDEYLNIGDDMPGLLVSPSSDTAVAVFLNQQGLKSRVTLRWSQDAGWEVTGVAGPDSVQ